MIFNWGVIQPNFERGEAGAPETTVTFSIRRVYVQLLHVRQPPTDSVFERRMCSGPYVCQRLSGQFNIHIFLPADLTEKRLNWG